MASIGSANLKAKPAVRLAGKTKSQTWIMEFLLWRKEKLVVGSF
jgi:hypothetical protein